MKLSSYERNEITMTQIKTIQNVHQTTNNSAKAPINCLQMLISKTQKHT